MGFEFGNLDVNALTKLSESIYNTALCPVCQELAWNPFILPICGHSFCYTCIKSWCQNNPSCPLCREGLESMSPVSNHTLKKIIQSLLDVTPNGYESIKDRQLDYEHDERNGFVWLKKLESKFGRSLVDNDDGVPRCSACHWELVDGQCENCGRTMVGWQDRTDGDDIDSQEEDDGWEDERGIVNTQDESQYLSDEDEDYDNAFTGRRRSNYLHDDEAQEDGDDDDENDDENDNGNNSYSEGDIDWGDDEDLSFNRRRTPKTVYESRNVNGDTILLDSDGERPVPGEPVKIKRLSSESHWESHDKRLSRKPWLDQYESDNGFVVDDDDDENENDDSGSDSDSNSYNDGEDTYLSGDNLASGDEDLLESNSIVDLDSDNSDDNLLERARNVSKRRNSDVIMIDDDDDSSDEGLITTLKNARKSISHHFSDESDDDVVTTSKRQRKTIVDDDEEKGGEREEDDVDQEDDDDGYSDQKISLSKKHKKSKSKKHKR